MLPAPVSRSRGHAFRVAMLLTTLVALALSTRTALAVEDDYPFHRGLPPSPPYSPNQRILVSNPPDGSVLALPPSPIMFNFRRFDFELEPSSLEVWIDGREYTESLKFWTDFAWLDEQALAAGQGSDGSTGESATPGTGPLGDGNHLILARIQDVSGRYHEIFSSYTILLYPCIGGCRWPFSPTDQPSVVSNLMEDWQDFGGTPYFHSGLDIRVPAGTPVHACAGGEVVKVVNYRPTHPSSYLYWQVTVQDSQGWVWQYHHLDEASIAVSEGQIVTRGQVLANVVTWSTSMNGFVYNHLHLNVVRWQFPGAIPEPYVDGFEHQNPLRFLLKGDPDNVLPLYYNVWFTDNESTIPFATGSDPGDPVLSGNVDVIAKLRDQRDVLPPANGQPYNLGLYKLSYGATPINTPCGMGYVPKTKLVQFDKMPGGNIVSNQDAALLKIYKQTLSQPGTSVASHFNYTTQQFYYTLTNTKNGVVDDANGYWDTDATPTILGALYPDGDYDLTVYAQDYYGNETQTVIPISLNNGLTWNGICPSFVDGPVWVHPLDLISQVGEIFPCPPPFFSLRFDDVLEGASHAVVDHQTWPVWTFTLPNRGLQVHIGLLTNHVAKVEYLPLLGDVIFDVDAEVQITPIGPGIQAGFDPNRPSTNPARLRLTTRLARDPWTGQPLIGRPARYGEPGFALVMAEPIRVGNETMLLRSHAGGSEVEWRLLPVDVPGTGPTPPGGGASIALRARPNPSQGLAVLELDLDRPTSVVVDVLDVSGRRVRQIHTGALPAGSTRLVWDGADALGHAQPPGLYFVRAVGAGVQVVEKVMRIR